MKPIGQAHYRSKLSDGSVRVIRALRQRHGWSYHRIAEVYDQPWRSIANYCLFVTRKSAGDPTLDDIREADRLFLAYREAVIESNTQFAIRIRAIAA